MTQSAIIPSGKVVDVHTHVYLPSMMNIMRLRSTVPFIIKTESGQERLVILPDEDKGSTALGRPIGDEYWNIDRKLEFMDLHGIDVSIVSTANPWLDFLSGPEQILAATKLNLGLVGVIMGTHGSGQGLDDPSLIPLFKALESHNLTIFLHPHYGIEQSLYGSVDNGHVLPLALGFPFETTIAVSRMILSGVFDICPNLKVLIAHSGGVLPFLAGRLDSCVAHDPKCVGRLQHEPSWYLKKLYFDSVVYHEPGVKCLKEFCGLENVMFGTDNPFFPPIDGKGGLHDKQWLSVMENFRALEGLEEEEKQGVLWENANRLFKLGI